MRKSKKISQHRKLTDLWNTINSLDWPETYNFFFRKEVDDRICAARAKIDEARKLLYEAHVMELEDEEKRGWSSD